MKQYGIGKVILLLIVTSIAPLTLFSQADIKSYTEALKNNPVKLPRVVAKETVKDLKNGDSLYVEYSKLKKKNITDNDVIKRLRTDLMVSKSNEKKLTDSVQTLNIKCYGNEQKIGKITEERNKYKRRNGVLTVITIAAIAAGTVVVASQ